MVAATLLRRSSNSVPFPILVSYPPTPKSFPCHTSENLPLSPTIATLPKTDLSNPSICHTSETPGGVDLLRRSDFHPGRGHGTRRRLSFLESQVTKSPVVHPLSAQLLTKCFSRNSLVLIKIHLSWGCTSLCGNFVALASFW